MSQLTTEGPSKIDLSAGLSWHGVINISDPIGSHDQTIWHLKRLDQIHPNVKIKVLANGHLVFCTRDISGNQFTSPGISSDLYAGRNIWAEFVLKSCKDNLFSLICRINDCTLNSLSFHGDLGHAGEYVYSIGSEMNGKNPAQFLLAEMVILNGTFSDENRQEFSQYLNEKYDLGILK